MDVVEIERDFTSLMAQKLNLVVDKQIFRGGVPAGKTGVGILFDSEIKDKMIAPRQWNIQVLAAFEERDDAMRFVSKVTGLFPCYDQVCNSCVFKSVSLRGNGTAYRSPDGGKTKWFASINLFAVVLTTGAQV
jgi:hypothetical protein